MKKMVLIIQDVVLNQALMSCAEALGYSVDSSNYERSVGEAISIGTSKKYTVAGNSDPDYYRKSKKKSDATIVNMDKAGFKSAVDNLLGDYTLSETKEAPKKAKAEAVKTAEKKAEAKTYKGVNVNDIISIYAKIKKQKKAPANYYIHNKGGVVTASLVEKGSVGNVKTMFDKVNKD